MNASAKKWLRSGMTVVGTVGLFVTGCAIPFPAPVEVAHIKLERVHSPVVLVNKVWFEQNEGTLAVRGYVLKRLMATDTTQTHLDVTLYDSTGTILRRSVEHFAPGQIPRRVRRADYATYRIELDPLPSDTTRIEIKAHEGLHDPLSVSAPNAGVSP